MSSKRKRGFTAIKGRDQVVFKDVTGLEVGLTVQTNDAEAGLLCISCGDDGFILLEHGLARELAAVLMLYAETLHVVQPPRKQEWLRCVKCGKKRWQNRATWVEGDWRCRGGHCSACGYSEGVYIEAVKKKGAHT